MKIIQWIPAKHHGEQYCLCDDGNVYTKTMGLNYEDIIHNRVKPWGPWTLYAEPPVTK